MKVIERIKNNKALLILFFLILLCLILMLFRLTKSYLDSKIEDEQEVDVDVTAQQTDDLKFIEGNPLSLNVNPTTLPQNGSNLVSTTHPRVELLANDASNSATYNYYVYVNISNNTFTYSDGSTPEILLSITNPSNTAVTSISGLSYVTQNGVSGFDVTNYNGLITVATNYAITSSNSTTATVQNWTFTLTYLNLNIDQSANIGKNFDIDVLFRKNEMQLLADVVKNSWVGNTGDPIVIKHDGTILDDSNNVLDAEDNSYRYTGGDYKLTQQAISAGYSLVNIVSGYTPLGIIGAYKQQFDYYIGIDYLATPYSYRLVYETPVVYYDSYNSALSKALSDGYIVSRNINNYVCFGYDISISANATTCPEQNLYRMIGAFDDDNDDIYNVKLIKYDYANNTELGTEAMGTAKAASYYTGYTGNQSSIATYVWKGTYSGNTKDWNISTLKTSNLNNYYLNTYLQQGINGTHWSDMIKNYTWHKGYTNDDVRPKTAFIKETANYSTYKVGLMNVTDFSYASNKELWTYYINDSDYSSSNSLNWLWRGSYEWTVTGRSAQYDAFTIGSIAHTGLADTGNALSVREAFYLNENVVVASGTGTKSDPYYLY